MSTETKRMYYSAVLFSLFFAYMETTLAFKCKQNCAAVRCAAPMCKRNEEAKYVGCSCCKTCIKVLGKGENCANRLRPMALPALPFGGQTDAPRVPNNQPRCLEGLYCHPITHKCTRTF
ncbi:uncharacterized protein [Parasteatoda tepidariorum]|uniref:uncharacterized protein n=1 Tax=Parasteatoda tepidariorum TaxID=114398 RepID=UPI0039BCC680